MCLTSGSLFSGIGLLDLGLERAGFRTIWHAETDKNASKVLARHWPALPNLGDVSKVDWSKVERPDVVVGGFPCQPFSSAGLRKGASDERFLWPEVVRCVRALGPRLVLLENVGALLSAPEWGTILGDLAEAGFNAEWRCIRASDVGAPHRRERVFLVATPADPERFGVDTHRRVSRRVHGGGDSTGRAAVLARTQVARPADPAADSADTVAHATGARLSGAEDPRAGGVDARTDGSGGAQPQRGGEAAAHTDQGGCGLVAQLGTGRADPRSRRGTRRPERGGQGGHRSGESAADPEGHSRGVSDRDGCTPADTAGGGCAEGTRLCPPEPFGDRRGQSGDVATAAQWGPYEAAIKRWAAIVGDPPPPVDGRGRLAPEFVTWMMGAPAGWTDGLVRTAALKGLGNGVVVHVGEAAGRWALELLAL